MKKRKITDNIPLKIMSVAIAVVLWLIVVNIDNPTGTNYYTLNDVELINKEYVESSDTIGKMCMPEQNQDSIKVAITATKKIRDKIKVTDISAVADLQQAVSLDTNPVMVPITVTCSVPGVSPSDIKVTPQNLSVNLDEKETQVLITLQDEAKKKTPKILTPKETILEQKREVSLKEEKDNNRYYVYVKGEVVLTTDSVSDAIIAANSQMGVVIGENQQYVWKRSRKTAQAAFNDIVVGEEDSGAGSIAQCVNAILEKEEINISVSALISQGETPKQILLNTLKDATVLDLTGCTVDEILYYVSNGYPVFAMTGSNDAVLVVGYDANNVVLYDPAMGQTYKRTTADADEMFFNAGNIFFTYQK